MFVINSVVIKINSDEVWVGDLVDFLLGGVRLKLKGEGVFVLERVMLMLWSYVFNKNVYIVIVVFYYDSKLKIFWVCFILEIEE